MGFFGVLRCAQDDSKNNRNSNGENNGNGKDNGNGKNNRNSESDGVSAAVHA